MTVRPTAISSRTGVAHIRTRSRWRIIYSERCSVYDVAEETQPLVLDETRLDELDEAWLPVVCADGPAVLIWPNSD